MKNILFTIVSAILIISISACSKPGTGGKATLSVHVFDSICDGSNVNVVPEATIYIKYGGTAVDADIGSYDDSQIADFGGKTVYESLRRGDYYLYAVSQDGQKTGGTHFEIKNRIGEREVVICTGAYE
ncbi:MAG TPA: hypothetical protein EYM84_06625 [Flavobacteriales bacterium]|nr:hypothetical protein [Flavobacteriales bacterium]HIN39928.1 hypothetical protein [Flavobacteriales bacterium]